MEEMAEDLLMIEDIVARQLHWHREMTDDNYMGARSSAELKP
jgi:hypothetical protein